MDIKEANKQLTDVYNDLKPIVESVVNKQSKEIDKIIERIKRNVDTLTNQELQSLMLQLSIEAYYFAHIKDMAILKQEISLALAKESHANSFNSSVGTQSVRHNQAVIDSIDKQTVNILYNAVANNMKSKLDEAHRMINVLSNILISKNAEAKLRVTRDDSDPKDLYNNNVTEN